MFFHPESSENQDHNISFDSPYKNITKNSNNNWHTNDSYNEENDFKKSSHNKVKALSKLGSKSKTVSKRKRRIQKTNLVKNYGVSIRKCDDFNSEHTDLALALSRSLQASEDEKDVNCTQSEENVLALRANLQKFGFKTSILRSSDAKLNTSSRQEHKKQGKFKFVTPTLFLRTEDDRNRIIANKVDAILSEQNTDIKENKHCKTENLCSEKLHCFYCKENKLFNYVNITNFYVEKLGLSPNNEKIGCYLKDWKTIPGRDRSPSPEKNIFETKGVQLMENKELLKTTDIFSKETQNLSNCSSAQLVENIPSFSSQTKCNVAIDNLHSETEKRINDLHGIRSMSPDLFESDEESLSLHKIQNNCHESSMSSENSNRTDFVPRNETEEQTQSICPSDSQLENSFNVTGYVMEILNHDSTVCLANYLKSTVYEFPKNATNLNSSKNIFAEQPHFSNDQSSKTTDKINSSKKLLEKEVTCNEFMISECSKDEMNTRCNFECDEDGEITSINLNRIDANFQNQDNTKNTREVTDFKIKSEGSVCSSKEKYSNFYPPIEISSEDDDNLPMISLKKKVKIRSTNSPPRKTSNSKSLEVSFENEINTYELPKLHQYGDKLAQVIQDKNESLEKREKQIENLSKNNIQDEEQNEKSCSTSVQTPKQQITIKVENVTPMVNYEDLNSPEICKELDKFGLKPLKRKRGIEFLKYIYESTHPVLRISDEVSGNSVENKEGIIKDTEDNDSSGPYQGRNIEIVGDLISEKEEDIIMERKRSSSKIATCSVPLHIAWFNFVSCNPQIKENILLYEPVQLEFLSTSLQEQGYKYNIEDLLHFLDKKCINIRRNNHSKGNRW